MLTRQEQLEIYTKVLMNPSFGIELFLETYDQTSGGFVPFKLFQRQKEIVQDYEVHRHNLVAKPRQAGISTTTAGYAAIKCSFADSKSPEKFLILANKQTMAFEFLGKIKDFLRQLPRWIWGPDYYGSKENDKRSIFLNDSKQHIKLPNGSEIKAVATSKDALRGFSPTRIIIDEAAFIDDGDEVYGAAMTSLSTGGGMILISTPNGYDPLYYKTYDGSIKGENDVNIINMRWYEDPRYNKDLIWTKDGFDEIVEDIRNNDNYAKRVKDGWKPSSSWYREMCRSMNNNKRLIAQELDVSFIGSGGSVIDDDDIITQENLNVREPQWVEGRNDEFWIWERPVEGHKYLLSSDVSRGDGEDSSTFVIIDFTTMEMVVEYIGKIPPDKLADIIDEYASLYDAYTVVDITGGLGVATVLKLIDNGFNNLHYDDPRNKLLANKKDLQKYAKEGGKMPGLNVNAIRLPMIALMEEYIRENKIKIRSIRMISEMRTFVYRNGRPDHMVGYHDDLLMALAMGLWVLQHSFKNLEKLQKQTKAMLAGWTTGKGGQVVDKHVSGFTPKGKPGTVTGKPKFTQEVARNMQDPTGNHLWLFSGMG